MKGKTQSTEGSNVFESALYEEFKRLQLGEPDEKVREAIEKATKELTTEVKRMMQQVRELEENIIRMEVLRKSDEADMRVGKKIQLIDESNSDQSEMVDDIVA